MKTSNYIYPTFSERIDRLIKVLQSVASKDGMRVIVEFEKIKEKPKTK